MCVNQILNCCLCGMHVSAVWYNTTDVALQAYFFWTILREKHTPVLQLEKCPTHYLLYCHSCSTNCSVSYKPPCRRAAGWVWLCNSLLCWVTSGMNFDSGVTSHSALTLALAAGRSTTGLAGHSLHPPGGGSGSDRLTSPKPLDPRTATVARQGQNTDCH